MSTETETERGIDFSNPQVATAIVLGVVLAALGIAAPLVAGQRGEFLGFGRNYLHDLVHLASGVAGLAAGYYAGGAYSDEYNVAMGAIYAVVAILGFLALGFMNDLLAVNTADNYLHVALMIAFLGVGALAARD